MEDDLQPVLPRLRREAPDPGENELVELRGGDQKIPLRAEVVAEKEPVHLVARQREEPRVGLEIEAAHPVERRMNEIGTGVKLDQKLLDAVEIHDVVEERHPEPAGPVHRTGVTQDGETLREIEIRRVGPGMLLDVAQGLRHRERPRFSQRLLPFPDVEDALTFGMPVCRVHVLRSDPAKIAAKEEVKLLKARCPEVPVERGERIWMGVAKPEAVPVSRAACDDGPYALAACHDCADSPLMSADPADMPNAVSAWTPDSWMSVEADTRTMPHFAQARVTMVH